MHAYTYVYITLYFYINVILVQGHLVWKDVSMDVCVRMFFIFTYVTIYVKLFPFHYKILKPLKKVF